MLWRRSLLFLSGLALLACAQLGGRPTDAPIPFVLGLVDIGAVLADIVAVRLMCRPRCE